MSNLFLPIQKAELDWQKSLPYSHKYRDIYHSSDGGVNQSIYVFIDGNDLISRWQSLIHGENTTFTIAETGFGIGLNFLVTLSLWEQYAPIGYQLHFISCEKHPVSYEDLLKCYALWPALKKNAQQLFEKYPVLTPGYHHLLFCGDRVKLTLMIGDALGCYEQLLICGDSKFESELRTTFVDAWYLDGFSPAKNKSMWSDSLFKVIGLLSNKKTTLATYTAASTVKNSLTQHGFIVEKRKGFGPKRHMLRARFNHLVSHKIEKHYTPWHICKQKQYSIKTAVIIGAGLAGCFAAYSLAKRGWNVTVIDELDSPGKAGSANHQAVLFPILSAYKSPFTEFMLTAFLYAVRIYKDILNKNNFGEFNGTLILGYNEKEQLAQSILSDWLSSYPELGVLVDQQSVSELAGISLQHPGLYIPLSGWINSQALCQFLINQEGVSLLTNQSVDELLFDRVWNVNNIQANVVILANSYKINSFQETQYLPIKPIRGQMTKILSTKQSAKLKVPLCAEGHILPAINGAHLLGATYDLHNSSLEINKQDDLLNINKLRQLGSDALWSNKVNGHWSGIRATTPDYLPLVGPVADSNKFIQLFASLNTNAKRWIPQAGPYYPGLYACAGFGSRGLTTIPLSAEWLASLINNEFSCIPRNLQYAISPARFLRKNIIRGKAKIN